MAKKPATVTTVATFAAVPVAQITPVAAAPVSAGARIQARNALIWTAASTVARAELGVAIASGIAATALKSAGIGNAKKQDAIREEYLIGYMGARMFKDIETLSNSERDAVRAVMVLANPDSKAAERRTEAQETLYKSAKKSWSRMLGYCGVETVSAQGGARARPEAAAKVETKVPAMPDARSQSDVITHVMTQASTLLGFANKATVAGIKGLPMMHCLQLVTTFQAEMRKVVAELEAEKGA